MWKNNDKTWNRVQRIEYREQRKLRVSERNIKFTLMFHCERKQLGRSQQMTEYNRIPVILERRVTKRRIS